MTRNEEFALFTQASQSRLHVLARREAAQLKVFVGAALEDNFDIFLDIGANIGAYAAVVARRCPSMTVHAFEAIPATFAELNANITQQKLHNVQTHQVALSDKEGEVVFLDAGDLSGSSAVAATALGGLHAHRVNIATKKLDDIVQAEGLRALIKLDVEGHEIPVLSGAEQFLTENDCLLQVEFLTNDAVEFGRAKMAALGYTEAMFIHRDHYFVKSSNASYKEMLRCLAFEAFSSAMEDYFALAHYAGTLNNQVQAYKAKNPAAAGDFPRINFPVGSWV